VDQASGMIGCIVNRCSAFIAPAMRASWFSGPSVYFANELRREVSSCVECSLFYCRSLIRANDYIFKMKDLARFSGGFGAPNRACLPEQAPAEPSQVQLLTISDEEAGQRIDNFLLRICRCSQESYLPCPAFGRGARQQGRIDQTYRLAEGDVVRVPPIRVAEKQERQVPGAEFRILLEDSHMLVIDKPAVAVHGGSGVSYGVIEQLRAARPQASSWSWCTAWTAIPRACC
jgi:hypothetical protein